MGCRKRVPTPSRWTCVELVQKKKVPVHTNQPKKQPTTAKPERLTHKRPYSTIEMFLVCGDVF
jgi:hypothetical protein